MNQITKQPPKDEKNGYSGDLPLVQFPPNRPKPNIRRRRGGGIIMSFADFVKDPKNVDLMVGRLPPDVIEKEYAEDFDDTGYRLLFGPTENLDDYPDIPKVYCDARDQPLRLRRKFKQRLPFPIKPLPPDPDFKIKPWMLEPFPPTIDWKKQYYKGIYNSTKVCKPLYIRWHEYPKYGKNEAEEFYKKHPPPTMREVIEDKMSTKHKRRGLLKIEREIPVKTPQEMEDYFEKLEKRRHLETIMIGDVPDFWWQKRKDEELRGTGDQETVGGRGKLAQEGRWGFEDDEDEDWRKSRRRIGYRGKSFRGRGGRGRGRTRGRMEEDFDDEEEMGRHTREKAWRTRGRSSRGSWTWNRDKEAEPPVDAIPIEEHFYEPDSWNTAPFDEND